MGGNMHKLQDSQIAHLNLIDVHHHVILPEYEKSLERSGARDPSKPLKRDTTPASVIDNMSRFGISKAIVNPLSAAGVHHGDDANADYLVKATTDAMAKFVSNVPDKLGFFAPLSYPDVGAALKQAEHALDVLNADGLMLLTNQNGRYPGDPLGEELWAELNRREAIVFVHPTRPANHGSLNIKMWAAVIEYPFETTRVATNLIYNGYMKKYPKIKWLLAHAGGCFPYLSFRLKMMEEQDEQKPTFGERHPEGTAPYVGQFYFDTAIMGGNAPMKALQEITDPSHILFGTDWPFVTDELVHEQLVNLTATDLFTGAAYEGMARGNAKALFPKLG
jgi:predicted TIM-barrel fold metal-dependent hydrolase